MKPVLLKSCLGLMLALAGRASAGDVAALDFGERLAACSACHGDDGAGRQGSDYYPHLAGKPADYLLDQLRAFRDGRRLYPQMGWLMRNMSDDYLEDIARFYAGLSPQRPAAATGPDAATTSRARELIEHGDAARGVPACSACHGVDLAGVEPAIPALLALPEDYVVAQLGAWRSGVRRAREPDCMAEIARALAPSDMRIVARWLAAQAHGATQRPAAAGSVDLPQACGALPAGAAR